MNRSFQRSSFTRGIDDDGLPFCAAHDPVRPARSE